MYLGGAFDSYWVKNRNKKRNRVWCSLCGARSPKTAFESKRSLSLSSVEAAVSNEPSNSIEVVSSFLILLSLLYFVDFLRPFFVVL